MDSSAAPTAKTSGRPSSPRPAAVYLALAVIWLVLYWPAFDNGFRQDDYSLLYVSSHAEGITDLLLPRSDMAFYRPGMWLLFSAQHRLFGIHAGYYIVFNACLHLLNSLLLLLVLRRAHYGSAVAAWAAGLFLLGYGHFGKSVMWASMGCGLLAVTASLAIVLGALAHCSTHSPATRRWLGLALALLAIGAPALHESAMVAPVVALLLCWQRYGRSAVVRRDLLLWTGAFVLLVAVLISTSPAHGTMRGIGDTLSGAPLRLVRYLGLMALPVQNSSLLSRVHEGLSDAAPVVQLVLGAAVLMAGALVARLHRPTRTLLAWMLIALAPFSLIGVPAHWLELRYVYFAAMPFTTLVAMVIVGRRPWIRGLVVAALIIVTISVTTMLERKYDAMAKDPANRNQVEWALPQ